MGLFSKIFGGGETKSQSLVHEKEGIFDSTPDSGRLAKKAESTLGSIIPQNILASLESVLGLPGAMKQNFQDNPIIKRALQMGRDDENMQSAMRLGRPATEGDIGARIAKDLMAHQNTQAGNLTNALSQLGQLGLGQAQGQTNLGQAGMKRLLGGNESTSNTTPGILGTLSKFKPGP